MDILDTLNIVTTSREDRKEHCNGSQSKGEEEVVHERDGKMM